MEEYKHPIDISIGDKINKNTLFEKYILHSPPNNIDNKLVTLLYPNTAACRDSGYLCKVNEARGRQYNRIDFESDKYKNNYLSKE